MQIIPFPRIIRVVAAGIGAQLWLSTAHAHLSVQVRGTAHVDADVDPSMDFGDDVAIRGRVRDELGESIAGVKVRLEQAAGQHAASLLVRSKNCGMRAASTVPVIETDTDGRFCARILQTDLNNATPIRVVFDGTNSYGSANATVRVDDNRVALTVDFGQLSHVVNLDASELAFTAEVHPLAAMVPVGSTELSLELGVTTPGTGNPATHTLQRVKATGIAPVHIRVSTADMGPPGLGDLSLSFEGNSAFKPFRSLFRIVRVTSVALSISGWPEAAVFGTRFSVVATAKSARQLPAPGFIECVGFDGNPKLLPLQRDGSVAIELDVPIHPKTDVVLFRYQSTAPGWQAEAPTRRSLQLSPSSRLNLVGWVGAGLLVLAWLAWSRRRAVPSAESESTAPTQQPYSHLEIVECSADPNAGWSGIVIDSHESHAIAGAVIELYQPGFDRRELLFSTRSDGLGRFTAPPQPLSIDGACRLEVKAVGYARLGITLPPPGRVRVHLVAVRRALLDRLVAWTKRSGHPFDSKAEPTPDWIAEIARTKGHPAIEAWARSVSAAAFGEAAPEDAERGDLLPPPGKVVSLAEVKRKDA